VPLLKGKDIDWGQIDRFFLIFVNEFSRHDREE